LFGNIPRIYRRWPHISTVVAVLFIGIGGVRFWRQSQIVLPTPPPAEVQSLKVIDGETLLVCSQHEENKTYRIRLLGVHVTNVSSAEEWLQQHCVGKSLRLEFDKRRIDRDEAWLAYIYADKLFVNAELVRSAFAQHERYPGDSVPHAKMLSAAATRHP
jgi:endonuclease YncB( thermonuclease family)